MLKRTFPDYARGYAELLTALQSSHDVVNVAFHSDRRSLYRGLLHGIVYWHNGSELHWREFVDLSLESVRVKYAYHYHNAAKECQFRYDNALHRPPLGYSDHKHQTDGTIIEIVTLPLLPAILDEIIREYL
jgi:Family of unknown function (DUF6516)